MAMSSASRAKKDQREPAVVGAVGGVVRIEVQQQLQRDDPDGDLGELPEQLQSPPRTGERDQRHQPQRVLRAQTLVVSKKARTQRNAS